MWTARVDGASAAADSDIYLGEVAYDSSVYACGASVYVGGEDYGAYVAYGSDYCGESGGYVAVLYADGYSVVSAVSGGVGSDAVVAVGDVGDGG